MSRERSSNERSHRKERHEEGPGNPAREAASRETGSVQLLRAAAELLGGNAALAQRLRVREGLLVKFMAGRYPLPPQLRLITVDLLLEAREARRPPPAVDGDPPARDSAP